MLVVIQIFLDLGAAYGALVAGARLLCGCCTERKLHLQGSRAGQQCVLAIPPVPAPVSRCPLLTRAGSCWASMLQNIQTCY